MKKYSVICAGLCVALAFTSCKSKESAYRKLFEKAEAQEQAAINTQPTQTETPVVVPVVEKPATETVVVDNLDNVSVRQEDLSVVSGTGLKNFSVVVGSYSVEANAMGMQQTLKNMGYDAQVAYNSSNRMYRVVASTFADKASAVSSRDQLRSKYPDAWLLFKK